MTDRLKILWLEDVPTDTELEQLELRRAGIEFEARQVQNEADFTRALSEFHPDLILADYRLPSYDGISALERVQASDPFIPFIFVSGAIGEALAIEALKKGATDYVLKDQLSRLAPVVKRALKEKEESELRLRAEEGLRASEKKYRLMFETAATVIMLLDEDGTITDCNRRVEKLGYEPAQLIGRPISSLLHPEDRERTLAILRRIVPGGTLSGYEYRMPRADGGIVDVSLNASALAEDATHPAMTIVIIEDITEKKLMEQRVIQSQKMEAIGRLAGGVAHDFNNLLTVIENICERLLVGMPSTDPRREEVLEIRHAGQQAASLTRRLLAFSRKQIVTLESLDLNEIVRSLDLLLERAIGENVELQGRLSSGPLWVEADSGQLEQVLLNLAINARDAMSGGGKLEIATAAVELAEDRAPMLGLSPGRYARLTVRDSGPGIPLDVQPHIFEPFFTTKGPGQGTGLGLSTVYGIVKQNGGGIRFESASGGGTVFEVYLPLSQPPAGRDVDAGPEEMPDFSGAETILVVEDEEVVRKVINLILTPWGYRVLEATNGEEALQLWRQRRDEIALIITDLVMPGIGGLELALRLAAEKPDVVSLFISGHSDELTQRDGVLEEGMAFLHKPFTSEAMLRKVRELLDR